MAISVVHNSNATAAATAASVVTSPTFTSTALNLLIACTAANGGTVTSVDGAPVLANVGADTWSTGHKSSNVGTNPVWSHIEWAASIAGHTGEAATYRIGAAQYPSAVLLEVSGYDTTTPNDVAPSFTSATSGTTLNSTKITPTAGQRLLVAVCQNDAGDAGDSQTFTDNGTGAATWTIVKVDTTTAEPLLVAYSVVTANGIATYGGQYGGYNTSGGIQGAVVGITAFRASAGGPTIDELGPRTSAGAATDSGVLRALRTLGARISAGLATVTVHLGAQRVLGSRTSTGVATSSGTLNALRGLLALSAGRAVSSAVLGVQRVLLGRSNGVATAQGILGTKGKQNLIGLSVGSGSASATLSRVSAVPPPVPVAVPTGAPQAGTAVSNYLDWPTLVVTSTDVSAPPAGTASGTTLGSPTLVINSTDVPPPVGSAIGGP
jgi:hypothetical protein